MIPSSTSSTDLNLRTVLQCVPHGAGSPGAAGLPRSSGITRAQKLAASPDYPSAAVIRQMIRQMFAAMMLDGPDSSSNTGKN